jgi:hypothetical protein
MDCSGSQRIERMVRKGGLECPHNRTFNDLQGLDALLKSLRHCKTLLLDWYWTTNLFSGLATTKSSDHKRANIFGSLR